MAIEKKIDYKGMDITAAYFKVNGFKLSEMSQNSKKDSSNDEKLYRVYVDLRRYTNSTKEHPIMDDMTRYIYSDVVESECSSIAKIYAWLKTLDYFKDCKDV